MGYLGENMSQVNYWNKQFSDDSHIWGDQPSIATEIALSLFKKNIIKKLLIPGVGYGRNSKPFTASGFSVTGVEISPTACDLAKKYDPLLNLIEGSIFDVKLSTGEYDAIFCFDVLHLFLEEDRTRFIKKCAEKISPNGFMFFTALSEKDEYFGTGNVVESNTFEVKQNKLIHFFTQSDLAESFNKFIKICEGEFTDTVNHKTHGQKNYQVRYIYVQKST